jgi:DNA-binding MarR family transcriptional regulator
MSTTKSAPTPESLSKTRLRLWLKFLKTSGEIEAELRRQLRAEFNTTLPRFDVMAALARAPDGLRMSDISQRLRVSNGNVTGIVERLVEEGLALRVAVQGDRRATVARLTSKGQEIFAQQAHAHESWINDLMGGLSGDELTSLSLRLDALLHHLEQE